MTANARNVAGRHARRDPVLAPSTTRASGSRPRWAAACRAGSPQHKNDPKIQRADPDARAVVPADPEPGRLRLHVHLRPRRRAASPCDYRVRTADDNRFWRKTLRDNNANGIYGDSQDGVDPNRNYPAKRGIDEEGASNTHRERDLPRPVRAVGAREPRGRPPAAARQVQGQHQLPLRRPAAADAGVLHDRLLPAGLDAVRRHHRHRRRRGRVPVPLAALVGPLRVQRRHDRQRVHELRHHRLDAGDGHLRDAAASPSAATSSPPRTTRTKVERGLQQEPARSRSTSPTRCRTSVARRTSTTTRATTRSSRPRTSSSTASTSPTARSQRSRRSIRKELGPSDITRQRRRPDRQRSTPSSAWTPRPRASATARSRATTSSAAAATIPATIGNRAIAAPATSST